MYRQRRLKPQDFQLISNEVPATLENVQYRCQIINNILSINLSQTFISQSINEFSETVYFFPISEGVCLESFEAKYDEKTIKGIVKDKSEAKKEYKDNKDQGNFVSYAQTSTIKDQEYCEIQLGNLPPNKQVEINLVFSQQLASILNKYYLASIPLIYCEDEISAKLGKNVLTLDLFCTGKINYAEARGYPVEKIAIDDNTARFNLSQAFLQKDVDFQLLFSYEGMFEPQVILGSSKIFNEDSVKSAILPVSQSVMVSFIPNFNEQITQEIDDSIRAAINNGDDIFSDEFQQKLNQELVDHLNSSRSEFIFLLDRSGSMSGAPITKACQALTLFLKSLPSDSYFNVISFGTRFEKLFPKSIKYDSQSLEESIQKISKYSANLGGTEIYDPLQTIFQQQKIQGYNRQIFLLTDGQVSSPQQVVNLIKKNNKFSRVHSIGFGSGADKYLINQSAFAGKGISKIVDLNCDLSEIIIDMLTLCITPTFDDFNITYDKSVFDCTYPSSVNFPCVFKDEIISIHFFFKALTNLQSLTEEQKKISIEYYDSHKKQKVQKEIKLEMQDCFTCNPQLQQSVFKIGKQLYLNENLSLEINNNNQLIQQAIDYQLLTKKTALICVIATLNDEEKIMYQNVLSNKVYKNSLVCEEGDQEFGYKSRSSLNSIASCLMSSSSQQKPPQITQRLTSKTFNAPNLPQTSIEKEAGLKCMPQMKMMDINEKKKKLNRKKQEQSNTSSTIKQAKLQSFESESDESEDESYLNQKLCSQMQDEDTKACFYDVQNSTELKESKKEKNKDKCSEEVVERKSKNTINEKPQIQISQSQLKLDDLLNLVNSEGIWTYNEHLISQLTQIDSTTVNQLISQFATSDAFMTLLILVILEVKYSQQRSKWTLISKKSLSYVKSKINEGGNINLLKQNIQQFVQN